MSLSDHRLVTFEIEELMGMGDKQMIPRLALSVPPLREGPQQGNPHCFCSTKHG